LVVKQNGVAFPICGELDTKWCIEENSGATGDGPFEFKWGDGSVSCSWFSGKHHYGEYGDYAIKVRVKNTCGFISERLSDVLLVEKTGDCTVGKTRCSPVYNAYDMCKEHNGKVQWVLKNHCDDNEICKDGGCVHKSKPQKCVDSDGGKNYYVYGSLDVGCQAGIECGAFLDYCESDKVIVEQYCDSHRPLPKEYECPNGCELGACVKLNPNGEGPIDIPEPEEVPCNGCKIEGKCYPFGYRQDETYCSPSNLEFVSQLEPHSECDNNFECKSNSCLDSECTPPGFWQKLFSWLGRLFG